MAKHNKKENCWRHCDVKAFHPTTRTADAVKGASRFHALIEMQCDPSVREQSATKRVKYVQLHFDHEDEEGTFLQNVCNHPQG
jgi:hypothetical protein